jgi:hypothetical protein
MMIAERDKGPRGYSTYNKAQPNIRVVYCPYGTGEVDAEHGGRPLFTCGNGSKIINYKLVWIGPDPFWVFVVDISGECVEDDHEVPHDFDYRALMRGA